MPEDTTFPDQINDLREAFSGLLGLLGQTPEGDEPGTGLAGAAALSTDSRAGSQEVFSADFSAQLAGLFDLGIIGEVTDFATALTTSGEAADLGPTAALGSFESLIDNAANTFGGELVERIGTLLDAVSAISEGFPASRVDVLEPLINQVLGLLDSLGGPQAQRILAWIRSLETQLRELRPLFEQLATSPEPSAVILQIVERTLEGILDLFGQRRLRGLFRFLDEGPELFLPQNLVDNAVGRLEAIFAAYEDVGRSLNGDLEELGERVDTAVASLRVCKAELRPVNAAIRRAIELPVARPGGLAAYLRRWMDEALAVRVQDVQQIEDPFNELLDHIDRAIEGIDLSFVSAEVAGFFETTREALETVDLASLDTALGEQLATVEAAVITLRDGVTELLEQIRGFFAQLVAQQRELLSSVGTFQPDGSFQLRWENDLQQLFTAARNRIGGDPEDPEGFSVAGSLDELRISIDGFLRQLEDLLTPLEETIETVAGAATAGIGTFGGYLRELDIPGLIDTLRAEIEAILERLAPIDFAVVVDPVIEEIEATTGDLANIDPESLNDLLRTALATALEAITNIELAVAITGPLSEGFATIKAVPADALEELQAVIDRAIEDLGELGPERLAAVLASTLDSLTETLDALQVTTLLAPLDAAYDQALGQPLARFRPSELLAPLTTAIEDRLAIFDRLQGETLLAPLTERLDTLKATITRFDLGGELDHLQAAIEGAVQDLHELRPSVLLEPVTRDFDRLEAELDRFRPSVVFAPITELAAPLLELLENVQEDLTSGLFEIFQAPLRQLDRLAPEALAEELRGQVDAGLEQLRDIDLAGRLNQLRAQHFDLVAEASAGGVQARIELIAELDPEPLLGEITATFQELLDAASGLVDNLGLEALDELYDELRQRLLAMVPPYARELLDPETFRRLMSLADPRRFMQPLDDRFTELENRLLPIRPADLAEELDGVYETVLALVDGLEIGDSFARVSETFEHIRGMVEAIRVDFLAAELDTAVSDLRAMVEALDPARMVAELDSVHSEIETLVRANMPSEILSELDDTLARIRGLADSFGHDVLVAPIEVTWGEVETTLQQLDIRAVLSPLLDQLDELERELLAGLGRTETAFDRMLGAAASALGGGGFRVESGAGGSL